MYCIVDIETTGNGIKGNKITEISIFKFDGYEVVDEFMRQDAGFNNIKSVLSDEPNIEKLNKILYQIRMGL